MRTTLVVLSAQGFFLAIIQQAYRHSPFPKEWLAAKCRFWVARLLSWDRMYMCVMRWQNTHAMRRNTPLLSQGRLDYIETATSTKRSRAIINRLHNSPLKKSVRSGKQGTANVWILEQLMREQKTLKMPLCNAGFSKKSSTSYKYISEMTRPSAQSGEDPASEVSLA